MAGCVSVCGVPAPVDELCGVCGVYDTLWSSMRGAAG